MKTRMLKIAKARAKDRLERNGVLHNFNISKQIMNCIISS